MDGERFDSVARLLGAAATRRAALLGVVAAVTPLSGEGKRRTKQERKKQSDGQIGAAGPCGNGGPRANRCRKDRDCCTGVCQKIKKGKYGRCRCRRRGQACTEDRNCCDRRGQNLTCQDGTCQPATCAPNCICEPECEPGRYCDPNVGSCCSGVDGPCSSPRDCCLNDGDDNPAACIQGECNFCAAEGAACSFPGTCCSEMCVDGECACYAIQEACTDVRQCCGFLSNTVSCEAGRCCVDFFSPCTSNEDCCAGGCVSGFCNA